MRMTRTRPLASIAVLIALLGACSSSPDRTGLAESVGADDVNQKPSSPSGASEEGGKTNTSSATGGSLLGNAAPPGSAVAQRPPQPGEVLGPGVLRDRIKIGYLVPDKDWDGVFVALGVPGSRGSAPGFGDQRAMYEAIVKDMNAHGGIAGRRVEPYYFTYSFNRGLDPAGAAAQSQEACSYWTQDNRVFAVVQGGFENWALSNCLVSRNVVHVDTSTWRSASNYRKIADYYSNFRFNSLDRQARDYGFGLGTQGFFGTAASFGKASKIGLLYSGTATAPDFGEAVRKGLEPELAKRGLKISVRAEACTECTNVVTRFRQEGITHVLFFAGSPVNPALFMQAAESQQFRPWYGIYTSNAPGFLLQYLAPPEQLVKSMGPGWDPNGDIAPEDNPYKRTAAEQRCLQLMDRTGQKSTEPLTVTFQIRACVQNWLLQEAMGRARPTLTAQALAGAMEKATGFYALKGAPLGFRYSADRLNNGHVQFRRLVFNTSCSCYRYTGPIQSMP